MQSCYTSNTVICNTKSPTHRHQRPLLTLTSQKCSCTRFQGDAQGNQADSARFPKTHHYTNQDMAAAFDTSSKPASAASRARQRLRHAAGIPLITSLPFPRLTMPFSMQSSPSPQVRLWNTGRQHGQWDVGRCIHHVLALSQGPHGGTVPAASW